MKYGSFAVIALFLGLGAALFFPACTGNQGSTGPQGTMGTSAVPTPYCTNPSSHGLTIAGTNLSPSNGGEIFADAVTLGNTVGINLNVNVSNSAPVTGQVRFAVYANNGTVPGILVAQSDPLPTVTGWNTATLSNVFLPAGTYWIAYMFSNSTLETYNNTGGNVYFTVYGWGQFPTTFPSGTAGSFQDAMYINTCP